MSYDILYYVPTQGRTKATPITLNYLQMAGLIDKTVIVCPGAEAKHWNRLFPDAAWLCVEPAGCRGIGDVRAFMFEHCPAPHFFMIDDDVRFSVRKNDRLLDGRWDPVLLRQRLYDHVLELFASYDTVGIGFRMFCQERPLLTYNKQTGWAWGYDKAKVEADLRPAFRRLTLHEDTDWCLTLLKAGHANVITSHIVSQARHVSLDPNDGGCAMYRTKELVDSESQKFYDLHSDVLTPIVPRAGLLEQTQYRFRVSWRRAFRARVSSD